MSRDDFERLAQSNHEDSMVFLPLELLEHCNKESHPKATILAAHEEA